LRPPTPTTARCLQSRDAQLAAVEADLAGFCDQPPFAVQVARLAAYRGVTHLGALTLAAEVADWRRFARASQFMGFCGLCPSESSSGERTWRGHITKAGNAHLRGQLVEAAWALKHRPGVGAQIARRQQGLDPQVVARAWTAQLRRPRAGGSAAWPPARPPKTWSSPPSPASSPASCGPR